MKHVKLLKALADETRLRILNLISREKLCVCELEYLLDISQSNASKHLERLKNVELVSFTKKAQWVYYFLENKTLNNFPFIVELLDDLATDEVCKKDIEKLETYRESKITCDDLRPLISKNIF